MNPKHIMSIEVNFSSKNTANAVYYALKPELNTKVQMILEDDALTLHLQADTVAALRALANSYLRWLATLNSSINTVKMF